MQKCHNLILMQACCFSKFTYLSYVDVVLTKLSQTEIRENPKGLPLEWGQFGAKASFSKMGVGVLK